VSEGSRQQGRAPAQAAPRVSDGRPALRAPEARPVQRAPEGRPAPRAPEGKPEDSSAFHELGLIEPLLRAVRAAGHSVPTPIQLRAIPAALEGRDVLGAAQTGTGKTAAFALPVLQLMAEQATASKRRVRCLVLTPTRELASQVRDSFAEYGRFLDMREAVIFGGVNQNRQVAELDRGVDILVATPGRLWDLLEQRLIDLSHVEHLILDEVDRMLDQGFWPTVRRIVRKVPTDRQTLLFSATMPPALRPLVDELLVDPVSVSVAKVSSTPEEIDQRVCFVDEGPEKRAVLADILRAEGVSRTIVFTRTKHGANRVVLHLTKAGIRAEAIHGNKSQNARERALSGFRDGEVPVLVATDIAARGLDIDGVSHVINYDLPVDPESYVHRIGRTARAGRKGVAFSLCTNEERQLLTRIERLIGKRVPAWESARR
jgi:ATP-dependent RNA helicase RhlE